MAKWGSPKQSFDRRAASDLELALDRSTVLRSILLSGIEARVEHVSWASPQARNSTRPHRAKLTRSKAHLIAQCHHARSPTSSTLRRTAQATGRPRDAIDALRLCRSNLSMYGGEKRRGIE